jgi:hypothetical protein
MMVLITGAALGFLHRRHEPRRDASAREDADREYRSRDNHLHHRQAQHAITLFGIGL